MINFEFEKLRWKVFGTIVALLLCVMFVLFSLVSSILFVSFDMNFYEDQFDLLDRPEEIGISEDDLLRVTSELLSYMAGEREALDSRAMIRGEERYVFNAREIAHMVDVKNLYLFAFSMRNILVISMVVLLLVALWIFKKTILKKLSLVFLVTSSVTFLLLGGIFLFATLDFWLFWDLFHRISFDNYLWLLDPRTDILIQMVPERFFFNTVMRIIISFVLMIGVPSLASIGFQIQSIQSKKRTLKNI